MRKYSILLLLTVGSYYGVAQPADRDYADLLRKSIRFFEAQACGPDVSTYSSFDWRGTCHVDDGNTVIGTSATYDLTGGWHDAGDHVKFNYPMAYAVYNLASLYVDHRQQIDDTGNRGELLKHLRFVGDYMIRCHPEPDVYVIQVATGERDHLETPWQIPEANTYERRVYLADRDQPNTNVACANAAAFAALSMAFRSVDDDYSADLLQHARDLYDFGYNNQRSHGENTEIPDRDLQILYGENNSFHDEIMIGAAWLFRATGESRYRTEFDAAATQPSGFVGGWAPGWGDHQYEATYQMARATGSATYRNRLEDYLTGILDGSQGSYSPGGMWYVGGSEAGFHLPASLGAAALGYRYADLVGSDNADYDRIRDFVFSQMNYALGDNPRNVSYVIDFGSNFPQLTHHRAATGGNKSTATDEHTLTGCLVMGPLGDDTYLNDINQIKCTEPSLWNNSTLALIATLMVQETDATAEPPTTTGNVTVRARGTSGTEQIEIRYNNQRVGERITLSTTFQTYERQVNNDGGNFRVAFVNDDTGRDAIIDWLQVGSTRKEAELMPNNTGAWGNGVCGGGTKTEVLHCNGYIGFGQMGDVASGQIVIRARSSQGSERMRLFVNGNLVQTFLDVSQSPANYTYSGYSGGTIRVRFDNDAGSGSADKNLAINYIDVCGVRREAEGATRSVSCGNTANGFVWLWCDSELDFGNVGCSSGARTEQPASKFTEAESIVEEVHQLRIFPNPMGNEGLTIQLDGESDHSSEITITDIRGSEVYRTTTTANEPLQVPRGAFRGNGLYLLKVEDEQGSTLRKIIVNQ